VFRVRVVTTGVSVNKYVSTPLMPLLQ
jgi:hypothetical protein